MIDNNIIYFLHSTKANVQANLGITGKCGSQCEVSIFHVSNDCQDKEDRFMTFSKNLLLIIYMYSYISKFGKIY